MLGGCSVSEVMTDWVSDDAAGLEPVNYRFLVANRLDKIIGEGRPGERLLEISSPRRKNGVTGAVWDVCLRTLAYPSRLPREYYSVSIRRDKIVESHLAFGVDQCERQSYAPFEWTIDMYNPVAR